MVRPRTPVEEKLAAIWTTVLDVESVGIHDNFFELGGDSILSIQIVAKAAQQEIKLKPNEFTVKTSYRYADPFAAALGDEHEVHSIAP